MLGLAAGQDPQHFKDSFIDGLRPEAPWGSSLNSPITCHRSSLKLFQLSGGRSNGYSRSLLKPCTLLESTIALLQPFRLWLLSSFGLLDSRAAILNHATLRCLEIRSRVPWGATQRQQFGVQARFTRLNAAIPHRNAWCENHPALPGSF